MTKTTYTATCPKTGTTGRITTKLPKAAATCGPAWPAGTFVVSFFKNVEAAKKNAARWGGWVIPLDSDLTQKEIDDREYNIQMRRTRR